MLAALIFWSFAIYGALVIVWQSVRRIRRRRLPLQPLTIILVVKDVEPLIEGILRPLVIKTAFSSRERQIWVFDVNSQDQTSTIIKRMMDEYRCLEYMCFNDDAQLRHSMEQMCLAVSGVSCIYDLRRRIQIASIVSDIACLCQ